MAIKNIFKKAVQLVFADEPMPLQLRLSKKDRPLKKLTERELIQLESQIGIQVFGPVPEGIIRREFFNLDKNTWIWHEEQIDADGNMQEMTTRYEVQPRGILKVQPNYKYAYIEGEELQNFIVAIKEYYERVSRGLYKRDPNTGKIL